MEDAARVGEGHRQQVPTHPNQACACQARHPGERARRPWMSRKKSGRVAIRDAEDADWPGTGACG